MVWNTMILSQYILTQRALRRPFSDEQKRKMILHYRTTRLSDGSWGMHAESAGYVYFTTLSYVALRVLGLAAEDPLCADARRWLARQPEGILGIPHWGKFWLAMCGLFGWEGVNPFPPELFLTPRLLPFNPFRFYNHTRYIYLGIAYLYGKRFHIDLGTLLPALRKELYVETGRPSFEQIDFHNYRHTVAQSDLYVPPSVLLKVAYDALHRLEAQPLFREGPIRKRALGYCLDRILYEVRASRYQGVSPVNGLLNCLAVYSHNPQHPELPQILNGLEAWKWEDETAGVRYCGARSNTWDTAFAILAITENPRFLHQQSVQEALQRAYAHLIGLQMQQELPPGKLEGREPILGGWCFSDGEHRWPVSDCTAEAVCALLSLHTTESPIAETARIASNRLLWATEFLLKRQNQDGGFGSYEARRAAAFLETVNPSEMYGSCMTERSYLECTASCVRGLVALQKHLGAPLEGELSARVNMAIAKAVALLRKGQHSDGSFPGFWGVNFTYGTFHVLEALHAAGVSAQDATVQRAAVFLLQKQNSDGGWGEHFSSCLSGKYVPHTESQTVNTSWALLALLLALPSSHSSIQRGVAFLSKTQNTDGSFPQTAQAGVFFGTAMLDYRLYKVYFPLWALARYQRILQESQ